MFVGNLTYSSFQRVIKRQRFFRSFSAVV